MASAIFQRAAELWAEMSEEYTAAVLREYERAEAALGLAMVNVEGRFEGVSALELFTGRMDRAYRYATPELRDWWADHPRIDREAFERLWLVSRGFA